MNFFQKLFTKTNKPSPANTDIFVPKTAPRRTLLALTGPGFHVGRKTDIGQHRDQNQDSIFTFEAFLESSVGQDPFGIFIIADGMGGYQKGEIASNLAARVTGKYIIEHIYLPYLSSETHSAAQTPINEVLAAAFIRANQIVTEQAPEAGTTLTAAVLMGNQAYLAHVGDSRAYLYNEGQLQQITQDHSLVARLVELGQATAEEALTHPQRNVLYRALGQTGALEVDTYLQSLPKDGYLLMCTDGLWGMVADDEMTRILSSAASPEDAVNKLINAANANGGDDNISALLIGLGQQ